MEIAATSAVQKKLKAAIVGCGRIGTQTAEHLRRELPEGYIPLNHAEAISSLPNLELVAVCDTDEGRARAAAETYKVPHVFTDYRTMLHELKPDILSIATRTAPRCEIIEFAASHGVRGIHAEKPFARSMNECRDALKAVAKHNVKLSFGATRRYMDIYRKARAMLAEGCIGELLEVTVELGRTMLFWNHPHSIDLIQFFAGWSEVEYISASCEIPADAWRDPILDADPIVENAFIKLANGVSGLITRADGFNIRLAGKMGTLNVPSNGTWIELDRNLRAGHPYQREHQRVTVQPLQSGSQRAFTELAGAVQDGHSTCITPEEIEQSSAILLGCAFSSIQGGRRIRLTDLPANFTVTGRFGELYA